MSYFVSYAQNCEDVVLWRALKDVGRGFYVDCGAYHPTRHSVTRAFYERGWRGINVEPVSTLLENFITQRPRDINLGVALADRSRGVAEFYEIASSGLSTLDAVVARQHVRCGFVARKTVAHTTTLSELLDEYAPPEIHFLKIDVEGAEQLVLSGMDFGRFRPWIVVVEATKPLTQEINASAWEHLLLDAGYAFAYFDGLNHFYVASEHHKRAAALAVPPNVFDQFVNLEQAEEINRVRASYEHSVSWRITAPLRAARALFEGLRGGIGSFATAGAVRFGALHSIVSESSLAGHLDEHPVMLQTRRER
jgi:FkbM family methyltransferase